MVIFIHRPSSISSLFGYRPLETRLKGEVGETSVPANADPDNGKFHDPLPGERKAPPKSKQAFLSYSVCQKERMSSLRKINSFLHTFPGRHP